MNEARLAFAVVVMAFLAMAAVIGWAMWPFVLRIAQAMPR